MLKRLFSFVFLVLTLNNDLILAIDDDDIIVNIWKPMSYLRDQGHVSLQTRKYYMSFRAPRDAENGVPGILVTSLKADLEKEENTFPSVRYILNKQTLGLDRDLKKINEKFESFLRFNNLDTSSLEQEKELITPNTNWAHQGFLEFGLSPPFYEEPQSSTTFVMNLLESTLTKNSSNFHLFPLPLRLPPVEISLKKLEEFLGEKGRYQDHYQDVYKIKYTLQQKKLKEENRRLIEQVNDLTLQIEKLLND